MSLRRVARLLSNTASVVQVAAVLYLLATGHLLSRAPWVIATQALAFVVLMWAWVAFPRGQFSTHPEPRAPNLVATGPYRWIRHPMYSAGQLVILPAVLRHFAPDTVAIALAVGVAVWGRVATEEPLLREKIPGWDEYARRTKRFVPFLF